jgi:hypothetical protein
VKRKMSAKAQRDRDMAMWVTLCRSLFGMHAVVVVGHKPIDAVVLLCQPDNKRAKIAAKIVKAVQP